MAAAPTSLTSRTSLARLLGAAGLVVGAVVGAAAVATGPARAESPIPTPAPIVVDDPQEAFEPPTQPPAAGPAVSVTAFGARPDDGVDDTRAIQAAVDSRTDGGVVVFPPGTYHQGDLLRVTNPGVRLQGSPGAVLAATDPARVAIVLAGDGDAVVGLTLTAPNATRRLGSFEHHRVVLDGAAGLEVLDNHIVGGPATGVFAFGATDYRIAGNLVEGTRADGIHNTYGARGGRISANTVRDSGDDCIAVVSYRGDGAISGDIVQQGNRCEGSDARGFTVVGGEDVQILGGYVEATRAAGIYLASEGSYDTYAAHRVTVTGNHLVGTNTEVAIDHAAIFSIARAGTASAGGRVVSLQNEDITLEGNLIEATIGGWTHVAFKNAFHARVLVEGQVMRSGVAKGAIDMGGTPGDQYVLRANVADGRPVPNHG